MVLCIEETPRCSHCSWSRNVWLETIIVGYHTCTVPDLLCVSSSCVCLVVVVVMRLAVLLVCASAWYRYVVRLGGDFGIVPFGGTVEVVFGRMDHSYYRGHRRRNHLLL